MFVVAWSFYFYETGFFRFVSDAWPVLVNSSYFWRAHFFPTADINIYFSFLGLKQGQFIFKDDDDTAVTFTAYTKF